jgi:hypothetical protein
VDQKGFGGSDGAVLGVEGIEVFFVGFDFVVRDDYGQSGVTVSDGVHAGFLFALF